MEMHEMKATQKVHKSQYAKLIWMIVISFIAMFILMYSMVDIFSNVIVNVNQFYMAGLMTAAMIIIEMLLMGSMYMNKKLNLIIISISTVVLIACFFFIRVQTGVSDRQFLKSMIPHHAAAILMVKGAKISDPEVKKLADNIIAAQQKEIDFMKDKLKEMDNK